MVAVVSDAIYPYHMGGKEVRYHHLCPRLARLGFDVHVYTMHWWDGPRVREADGVRYTAISRCLPLYVKERRSILQAVVFSLGCLRLLWKRFDAVEADQMPYLPLFSLRLVAWIRRVPLIVTWHEVWGDEYWRHYLGRAGMVGAMLERAAMRLPDSVLAVNTETRSRLVEGGVADDRVTVVGNGVDLDAIAAAPPSTTVFDLIYVGRLIEHKRVADLVDAIGLLANEGIELTCAIVGAGPERTRLEHLARKLGIGQLVRFVGSVADHQDVYGMIKSSGIFVLPSVREGFGIVVVEAFACGVPVITTNHPDNQARLLVDDGVTGWLSAPTGEGLAAAIRRGRALGPDADRVRALLDDYDWNRIAERLAGMYQHLGTPS